MPYISGLIVGAEVSILFTSVSPGITILQDYDWSLTDLMNHSTNTSRYPRFLIPLLLDGTSPSHTVAGCL
ncbi:hypothetical protein BKA82DRAFT_1000980 [Pisolithus tinctorius]|uniref:Uncharacterized protein n=1 Tax=Pisolithus tinctorius Marx 270 TaxID=870435 RepID=A0A0C3NSF0_PISTI|nr:hypothetical protein BKA82DRAFT_1000980 [Pisolithus tinctorius]KIO03765.1 hypothetical protein M404DRAFT_1000980 [Pisolithus tinctorius Marx 270]